MCKSKEKRLESNDEIIIQNNGAKEVLTERSMINVIVVFSILRVYRFFNLGRIY